MTSTVLFY